MIATTRRAVLALGLAMGVALPVQAESLRDALTSAYNTSGLLDQNRALLRAADEDLAQAVATTRPVVNWSYSVSNTFVNQFRTDLIQHTISLSAALTLYDGGANQLAIEAQKETILAARQGLRSAEQDILFRAVEAYMNVLKERSFVELRQNNVRVITQQLRAAEDRFEVGEATRTDVALAQAQLASARSLLVTSQGALDRAIEEYRAAIGRDPVAPQAVSPAPVSRSEAEAKAFAVRNHPAILEQQFSVAAAELQIRRAEAATLPTVTLNGRAQRDDDFNDTVTVGITASGPIYSGGRLASQVRQFMARRDAARAGLHVIRTAVEQQVGNAYSFLLVARASRQAFDEQIRAAQVAFRGLREEATLGAQTMLVVLEAEQDLLDAQANAISAQAEEVIASYAVLAAMGLLTAEHLNLPVQQYDPSVYYNLVKSAPLARSAEGQALERVLEAIGR